MYRLGKYNENDSMSDLICDDARTLPVMSRFGIALGFGDSTIGEVCRSNKVDVNTFLTVVNLLTDEDPAPDARHRISVGSLLDYLHNSHEYFLEFRLPAIRTQLAAVLKGNPRHDLAVAIMKYFDEYVAEVRHHMEYEEKTVFPYVRALVEGRRPDQYSIAVFSKRHDQVEARLTEFKHIIIKYFPAQSTNEINNVLFDIFNCEQDLASHNEVEDRLFVPAIQALENEKNAI